MAGPNDQDKLAEDWTPPATDDAALSADWAAMLESDPTKNPGTDATDRVLNQDEIDSLLGFDASTTNNVELTGVQALNSGPSLVLPVGWYKPNRMIEVFVEAPLRVKLTELVERGADFERVAYEIQR